ncbi:LapA family protein [Beggiatoa alba]|nr:LapA family protein [Beggiatoa alba]
MKRIFYITAIILTLVVGAVFSARNADLVQLDFIFIRVDAYLSLAIIIALILGACLGLFASLVWLISAKRELQHMKKQFDISKKELDSLRAIPIRDEH